MDVVSGRLAGVLIAALPPCMSGNFWEFRVGLRDKRLKGLYDVVYLTGSSGGIPGCVKDVYLLYCRISGDVASSAYRGRDDGFRYRMRCWMLFWIFHPALRLISAGLCWLSGQYVAVQPSAIDFGREDAWESMTSVNSRQDRAEIMP